MENNLFHHSIFTTWILLEALVQVNKALHCTPYTAEKKQIKLQTADVFTFVLCLKLSLQVEILLIKCLLFRISMTFKIKGDCLSPKKQMQPDVKVKNKKAKKYQILIYWQTKCILARSTHSQVLLLTLPVSFWWLMLAHILRPPSPFVKLKVK